jgi:hypothetical protein
VGFAEKNGNRLSPGAHRRENRSVAPDAPDSSDPLRIQCEHPLAGHRFDRNGFVWHAVYDRVISSTQRCLPPPPHGGGMAAAIG